MDFLKVIHLETEHMYKINDLPPEIPSILSRVRSERSGDEEEPF